MVLLYLASTLYHTLPRGKAKRAFQVIEHAAIFLRLRMPLSGLLWLVAGVSPTRW
jgi:hypothetical protein